MQQQPTNYTLAELDEMLAVEAKATPGEWEAEHRSNPDASQAHAVVTNESGHELFDSLNRHYKESGLESEVDEDRAVFYDERGMKDLKLAALARNHFRRLIEEVKRLKEDEARLDWLERQSEVDVWMRGFPEPWRDYMAAITLTPGVRENGRVITVDDSATKSFQGPTLRAAIDAAREKPDAEEKK